VPERAQSFTRSPEHNRMIITDLRRQKGSGSRVGIHLDGSFAFSVDREVAEGAGLRQGSALTEADISLLTGRDEAVRCHSYALRLLERRARTTEEMRRRLKQRGISAGPVEECIGRLTDARLLDDAAYARAFVEERIRNRPAGRVRLLRELLRRGISREIGEAAIANSFTGTELEQELARRALAKFSVRRGESPGARRRRAAGFLARRGFSASTVRAVLDEVAG
jgi:regulatory protein